MPSTIDISNLFGKVRTAECMGLVIQLYPANLQAHEPLGPVNGFTLHWEATDRDDAYNDYHQCILHDPKGKRACIAKCLDLAQKGQHAWGRNTGLYGIALAAMATGFPATQEELDAMSLSIAEGCFKLKLNPRGKLQLPKKKRVGNTLVTVAGFIEVPVVHDHAHLAARDGYKSERWDIGSQLPKAHKYNLYAPVVAEALVIYDELVSGKRKPSLGHLYT